MMRAWSRELMSVEPSMNCSRYGLSGIQGAFILCSETIAAPPQDIKPFSYHGPVMRGFKGIIFHHPIDQHLWSTVANSGEQISLS